MWSVRRHSAWLAVSALWLASAAQCQEAKDAGDGTSPALRAPHVVVILVDDLGWGDLSCYSEGSKIATPNIDRLASEGLRYTDAHSPSSVCSPSRYGLLTGRYAWRTRLQRGIVQSFEPLLIEPETPTLPGVLREHGYATACIGKWHLGFGRAGAGSQLGTDASIPLEPGPNACGFDYFFGSAGKPGRGLSAPVDDSAEKLNGWYIENEKIVVGDVEEWKQNQVGPTLTQKAQRVIRRHAKDTPERPLFLYFSLTAIHVPMHPARFVRGKSDAGEYGDFVLEVDWSVGRILAVLEKTGMADDTLVIVTSDNGPEDTGLEAEYGHRSTGPYRGWKRHIREGGHRVPLIVRWPGRVAAGSTSEEVVCLTDLMPTCAAAAGIELPEDAAGDGYDLTPTFTGRALDTPLREATVLHDNSGRFALRRGRWKYVEPGGLYDLEDDPGEFENVADEQPEIVMELSALLERYRKEGRSRPGR